MESELDLKKIQDEVFRKIGRNLRNFQKIEGMLKYLIANGRMKGYISEIKENQKRRSASINKQTMGQLAGKFMDNTYQELADSNQTPVEVKEPYFSFSFTIESDPDFYESKRQALKALVDDRNDLIHHLSPRFTLDTIESCMEIEQYLDQQRKKLIPEYEYLQSTIKSFDDHRKAYVDFLNSDEGKNQFNLSCLRQSQLSACLFDYAEKNTRPDGWVTFSSAASFIQLHSPKELTDLEKMHGHKKLKSFMLATELFDISEEQTDKGGIRVLYRIKPNSVFSG